MFERSEREREKKERERESVPIGETKRVYLRLSIFVFYLRTKSELN